jgi:hypothetical protein
VKQELGATDKQLQKIDKQLQRLKERAALEKLKGESVAYQKAIEDLARAQGKLTAELSKQQKVFNAMGSFANKANEIAQFGGSTLQAAQALFEFAKGGAEAAAVVSAFEELGGSVATLERLQQATAGVVDETSLQKFGKLAADLGLTSEEMAGLAQRATELAADTGQLANTSEVLTQLLNGEVEALRKLGIAMPEEQFAGMTEAQKKLAIAQELATQGSQAQVDSIDSSQLAFAQAEASVSELISTVSIMVADFINATHVLDILRVALEVVAATVETLGSVITGSVDGVERLAMAVGLTDGQSLRGAVSATTRKLENMKIAHEASAAAALKQAQAVGVLTTALEGPRVSFDRLLTVMELTESATGPQTLADQMLIVGGSFEGAEEALADFVEEMDAANESGELVGQSMRDVENLVNAASERLVEMEKATKNQTAATSKRTAAIKELQQAQEAQSEFEAALLDEAILAKEQEIQASFRARLELMGLLGAAQSTWNELRQQDLEVTDGILEQQVREIENLQRKNELLAEADQQLADTIGGFESLGSAVTLAGNAMGGAGDKLASLVTITGDLGSALKEASGANQQFGAAIAAGKAVTAAVVDDASAQAAILGLFETAESAAAFASANIVAGVAHAGAAALYFGVAAKGGKGGGGGGASAGAGTASAAAAQTPTTQIIEEPTLPSQSFGVTNFFNVESTNPDTAGDNILSALNAFTESGSGALLSPDLIGESQGRSGL